MSRYTYLVTGANRGIGFEIVRQLLAEGKHDVIAVVRSIATASPIKALVDESKASKIVEFDITDRLSIKKAVKDLKAKGVDKVDILINNAGAIHELVAMEALEDSEFERLLRTNVVGANSVISEFMPLLQHGHRKVVVNISSGLGSISMNTGYASGGYNVSKAALNMLTKQYAVEKAASGFTFIALDPGWVQTDMGGKSAPLSPNESVSAIVSTVSQLTPKDNGKYMNRFGETLPF
ncbi:hypothetical protein V1525DRAFT_407764 [Lipomyces kononenkoae]|uniref:Uncharacterized protein n=1 Tax=Lipomyces kononenkoae TaxID=34357 RepID=A0ACC3SXK6_LIPKO